MKLEELIAALNKSNIDMNAQEEIIVKLNRYENAQKSEYFTVLETCKEDIIHGFEGTNKIRPKIDKLTDKQMKSIAADVSNQLFNHYWEALELAMKAELEEGKMSYYVTILTCNLHYTNRNNYPLNPKAYHYPWYSEERDVLPVDYTIKWSESIINDFNRMIEEGIYGTIEIIVGEEGERSMFELTKHGVNEYHGQTTYPDEPDVIHTSKEQ